MNRRISLTLATSLLTLLICAPAYGQRRNRTKRQEQPPAPTPAPYPNLDFEKFGDKKPACSLTLEQAPTIRGFRLGMSLDEVMLPFKEQTSRQITNAVESRLREGANRFHGKSTVVLPDSIMVFGADAQPLAAHVRNPREFENVTRIAFVFLDRRLFGLTVEYDMTWQSLEQFVGATSSSLNLTGEWTHARTLDGESAALNCQAFEIQVGLRNGSSRGAAVTPYVKLRDTSLEAEIEKRKEQEQERIRKEAEEQERRETEKRRVFKP